LTNYLGFRFTFGLGLPSSNVQGLSLGWPLHTNY